MLPWANELEFNSSQTVNAEGYVPFSIDGFLRRRVIDIVSVVPY